MVKLVHSLEVGDEFYVLNDIVEIKVQDLTGILIYKGRIKRFIYGGTNDCVVLDTSTKYQENEHIIDIDSICTIRRIDIYE